MTDFYADEYFLWLCSQIENDDYAWQPYSRLLIQLYKTDFMWVLCNDSNRAADGLRLREDFLYEIDGYLGKSFDEPCSILEMMIGLAKRCEEDIMQDMILGDRTPVWFWEMIGSLGLDDMSDDHYYPGYVEEVLDNFMARRYSRNGNGSIFSVKNPGMDFRRIELWDQMWLYLNENYTFSI